MIPRLSSSCILLGALALLRFPANAHAQDDFASSCASFIDLIQMDNVTTYATEFIPAGTNITLEQAPSCSDSPSQVVSTDLCRIRMNVTTSERSEIRMEAWFPQNYTGRFLSTGNGGLGGCIQYSDLDYTSSLGFATVGANNGHEGQTGVYFLDNPEVITDFAWRSVHTGVVVGKELTELFYGAPHNKSYYLGCSTGGRQGFKMVQDFPEDFDGVLAGAPAVAWNDLLYWSGSFLVTTGTEGSATFVPTKMWTDIIHQEVINQCDALDGATDGVLENPDLCDFNPTPLICSDGDTTDCLTETQIETVVKLLSAVYDENGELAYPRMQPGAEVLAGVRQFTGQPYLTSTEWWRYAIHNDSTWDPATMGPADRHAAVAQNPAGIAAFNGNVSAFQLAGGKVLHYHGLMDDLITSDNSKRYYSLVQETMGKESAELDDFYRFFPISGMSHCSDGDGAYKIGNLQGGYAGASPDENVLMALVQWVEKGVAPEVVRGANANETYWRAHCKWPKTNKYVGPGSYEDESAWQCA
ncbi:Tannase/feruloyl esterase [Schizophyllum amplum]|uniref:Carboxylic ester hydrolase n=1 Tax=Schizophyllum amplum TaxID=97359 RepID=A0A550CFM5_9AGAR|nr:Tannase/feruloyl esterase [Auriculariopsis ampla]